MPTVDEIAIGLLPEFGDVDSDRRTLLEGLADSRVSASYPAAVRNHRVALETLRMYADGALGVVGGAVTSESIGPLSISYSAGSTSSRNAFTDQIAEMDAAYIFAPMTRTMG